MLKQGSQGKEVKELQIYLDSIGYKIKASGYFDFITTLCVKDFQRHVFPGQPKEYDGIVGNKTRDMIKKYNSHNYCPEVFEHILGIEENSPDEIEKSLRYGLVGYGDTFWIACNTSEVKWPHFVAKAAIESGWNTSKIATKKNNIYGYCAYDSSPFASAKKFKDVEDCIYYVIPRIKKNYLLPTGKYYHGDTQYGINVHYASSPIAGISKAFLVRSIKQAANS
jgi:beta-N-acetylglucosaminidase